MQFRFLLLFVLSLFIFATPVRAETGFLERPLWISPEEPKEGEMVTLSAAFLNSEEKKLTGTVVFSDGEVLLGKKTITIDSGNLGTASVMFRIGSGDHNFSAVIQNISQISLSGETVPYAISIKEVELPKKFIAKKTSLAQETSTTSTGSNPITSTINNAEQKVIEAVPKGLQESVLGVSTNITEWREEQGATFSDKRDAAKEEIVAQKAEKEKAEADIKAVNLTPEKPTEKKEVASKELKTGIKGPIAHIKHGFFAVLAFIFNTPVAFYLLGAFILFLIIRFIYRKIRNRR